MAENLLIAIDFDQTFTADETLWTDFIAKANKRGHKVICVTARRNTFEHRKYVYERLPESVDAYFAYDRPKRDFITSVYKLWPDIWIDDIPEGI